MQMSFSSIKKLLDLAREKEVSQLKCVFKDGLVFECKFNRTLDEDDEQHSLVHDVQDYTFNQKKR